MNSKDKGKRGEREFRDVLRAAGFCKAYRGQQFQGSPGSPDVVCPELPGIHWEVKRCEAGSLYKWLAQAIGETGPDQIPIVAHKKNNCEWVAIIRVCDLLDLVKETDRVKSDA